MLLSQRIVVTVSIALLFLSAGFLVSQEINKQRHEEQAAETAIAARQALWQNVARVELNAMRNSIRTITRNRDGLSALAEGNIDDIYDEFAPTFNRLSASKVADRLILVNAGGRTRLRAATPPTTTRTRRRSRATRLRTSTPR